MNGSGESPAGARRRVRLAVRQAREDRGYTQSQVAEEMEWSLSKVMRIENGEVTVAPNDLRPLLSYLGIKDKQTIEDLLRAAKLSKQRKQWWDAPEMRDGLTTALRQVVQLEPEATAVRYFVPLIFPGPLQTASYARAVLNTFREEIPERILAARHAVRMRRREGLITNPHPPVAYTLLDESVYHRRVGGAAVLSEQITDILRLIEQQRIVVRTIPLEQEVPVPMLGTYEIIYLDAENDRDAIMYRESDLLDEIVDDVDKIRRHRATFERLWDSSYDEQTSVELMSLHLKELATHPEAGVRRMSRQRESSRDDRAGADPTG